MLRLLRRQDKPRAVQFDPRRADAFVRLQGNRHCHVDAHRQVRVDDAVAFRERDDGLVGI